MSAAWWGKERWDRILPAETTCLVPGEWGPRPRLVADTSREVVERLRRRRPDYAPDWSDPEEIDAGWALARLFGSQAAPVLKRLNRLPDKAMVEFLRLAGIQPEPARAAMAMVQFEVSQAARGSVLVAEGFQVGARPATGSGDLVVFETQHQLMATAAELEQLHVERGGVQRDVTEGNKDEETTFRPLGDKPRVGDALLLGLACDSPPTVSVSLGIRVAHAPGEPPPVSSGGVAPIPLPAAPVLQWEVCRGSVFEPADVLRGDTRNLWRSGIVQLRLPRDWRPTTYIGEEPRYWLRLRLVHGDFEEPPELVFIRLNMAVVKAVRTYRNEVLEPVGDRPTNRMRLLHAPVVPKSLTIEVDATPLDEDEDGDRRLARWREVHDLSEYGPQDRVFTLDAASGIVTFGDGTNGAAVPPGFRNVQAVKYEVGSGQEGGVQSDEITTLLNSAPMVTGASNPLPASGGVNAESRRETIQRGPAAIRAQHRAVTVADYALMARFAPGADVRKAHAIANFHPWFPGQPVPGVVGVLICPPVEDGGPPIPDEAALRAVSEYLTREVAPAGVEVVAAAPRFRRIRTEVGFQATEDADVGQLVRRLIELLDQYLHPLSGGADGRGWPVGGTLRFSELMRHLLSKAAGVRAIPRLRLIVDGVPQNRCADVPLGPTELFWPEGHQVIPESSEIGS